MKVELQMNFIIHYSQFIILWFRRPKIKKNRVKKNFFARFFENDNKTFFVLGFLTQILLIQKHRPITFQLSEIRVF